MLNFCNCRASYPDMGGSWVKQVELDEPMQVSDVHWNTNRRKSHLGRVPWYSLFLDIKLKRNIFSIFLYTNCGPMMPLLAKMLDI